MLPTGPEDETARDGLLSSRAEVHAAAIGVEAGLRGSVTEDMLVDDVHRERWYFAGGFVAGWAIARYTGEE